MGFLSGLQPTKLFPILSWILRYNTQWLVADFVAGLTIGMLLIPQCISFAVMAGVPIQHGLYTALAGVLFYMFFSTAKDVTIGPTAVLSAACQQVVQNYNQGTGLTPIQFLISVSFVKGCIELFLGIFQFGILVELISTPVIHGFTTGAAISIICSQLPGLLGIPGINKREAAFLVFGNTAENITHVHWDMAIGLSTIVFLWFYSFIATKIVNNGHKWGSLFGNAGNSVAIILFTCISLIVNASWPEKKLIKVLGHIPSGLSYMQAPNLGHLDKVIPAAATVVLVAIVEHIAVAKAFSRLNGYKIRPNQEIGSIGITNILGSFLGAFPMTGAFSRTAVKSKSGVKTPLADIFTAIILIISIFYLTEAFGFIPKTTLCGIIIFAISKLISTPKYIIELYHEEMSDFLSFMVAMIVTLATSIKWGIVSAVLFSILVIIYRIAYPALSLLAKTIQGKWAENNDNYQILNQTGIAIFRIEESLTYPNCNYVSEHIKNIIDEHTLSNEDPNRERLWCESPSSPNRKGGYKSDEPSHLKGLILDLSSVNHIDSTGVHCLVDINADLKRHAGKKVPLLFVNVHSRLARKIHRYHKEIASGAMTKDDVMEYGSARVVDKTHDNENGGCCLIFSSIDDAVKYCSY
jgi:sodium-independent sulfate anion transporter 11